MIFKTRIITGKMAKRSSVGILQSARVLINIQQIARNGPNAIKLISD